ncbi:hypothetical protein [Ekhidna sp.]|uniref:hypothetical protein n=1 Tax=Ekhidna sp. TaxID=2608089 RepID=UPI003BAB51DB
MKFATFLLVAVLIFVSCTDADEATIDTYQVSVTAKIDAVDLIETARMNQDITFTDVYFSLMDSTCNEIESEGHMIYDGELPPVVLPNIPAGKYYYSLKVSGSEGISYENSSNFTIHSDTTLEALLENHQMRYRFVETSDFDSANAHYVNYLLNFTSYDRFDHFTCPDSAAWITENYDGYVDASGYPPYTTEFQYYHPLNLESVQIKFYGENSTLMKSHIIPLEKELLVHHSYTFKVDLSSIWSGTETNSIQINLEDVTWIEEDIELME